MESDPKSSERTEKSKPRKQSIEFESSLPREAAISYFEAVVAALKGGSLTLRQGEESITLEPQPQIDISVRAEHKANREKLEFHLKWKRPGEFELAVVSA